MNEDVDEEVFCDEVSDEVCDKEVEDDDGVAAAV